MSSPASPDVPERPAEERPGDLTPGGIDRLLADFRSWLVELALGISREEPSPLSPAAEPPDLHSLLGQMIAVRQEVNLQTKAVRAQQEQNAETLEILSEAVDQLRQVPQPSPDEVLRPLLKTLVDVHDALSLALKESQRVQETVLPLLGEIGLPDVSELALGSVEVPPLTQTDRPLLARLLGVRGIDEQALADWREKARSAYEKASQEKASAFVGAIRTSGERARQCAERVRPLLASLVSGYRMGLQRIERALEQNGLEPIPAVGEPFDPERMEVLEAVEGTGHAPGEVLDEVRRGYLWRGRLFRFAQVRVARS